MREHSGTSVRTNKTEEGNSEIDMETQKKTMEGYVMSEHYMCDSVCYWGYLGGNESKMETRDTEKDNGRGLGNGESGY